MATMSIANPSREQIVKREGPLIEKAIAKFRKAKGGEFAETERELIISTIISFDNKLQRKEYRELYSCVQLRFINIGQEQVRAAYAVNLFNAALEERQYATALQVYDLIAGSFSPEFIHDVPDNVFRKGNSLCRRAAVALAEKLQNAEDPRNMLKNFGLFSPGILDLLPPLRIDLK